MEADNRMDVYSMPANIVAQDGFTDAHLGLLIAGFLTAAFTGIAALIAGILTAVFTGIAALIAIYNFRKRLRLSFVQYTKRKPNELGMTEYQAIVQKKGSGIVSGCYSIVEFNGIQQRRSQYPCEELTGVQLDSHLKNEGQVTTRTEIRLFAISEPSGDQKGDHCIIVADHSTSYESFEALQEVKARRLTWNVVAENAIGISKEVTIGNVIRNAKEVS